MNDLVVDGSADAAREPTIALECGDAAFHANDHFGKAIEFRRGNARLHPRTHFAQYLRRQAACLGHFLDLLRGLLDNHALTTFLKCLSGQEYTE